jgi:omega-6 fatty acid desaturase (delta-12 desaturase)
VIADTEVPFGSLAPAEESQSVRDVPPTPGFWRESLSAYARPRRLRSAVDFVTSVVAYLALSVAMYFALEVSPVLALALAPVTAVFLLRTYIIFHDCSHGSLFASRRANAWLGILCGLLVLSPFVRWRHDHAVHHATSGDLDKRGVGDLPTLTVAEYQQRSRRGRLVYRIIRSPLVVFGLGPVFAMIIGPRIVARNAPARMRNSLLRTDLALAAIAAALFWAIGVGEFLLLWAPAAMLAGAVGIWLSTSSTSSRTPTGSVQSAGATRTPRCVAVRFSSSQDHCSSRPGTSAFTTSTTSASGFRTTTSNARTS